MEKDLQAIARWRPRIDWPDCSNSVLIADALEAVVEHQAAIADERHIPDDLRRAGSSCTRKRVINFVREEHSSYRWLVEDHPHLREPAREKINAIISQHYGAIPCTCRRCP